MKKFLLLILILGVHSATMASNWERDILVEGKRFLLDREGLQVDSQGHLHLAYGGTGAYYAYFDGLEWHSETIEETGQNTLGTMLQLDSQGKPIVAFYDQENKELKIAKKEQNGWITTAIIPYLDNFVDFTMKIDSQDEIHIAMGAKYSLYYIIYTEGNTAYEEIPGEHEYISSNLMLEIMNPEMIVIENKNKLITFNNGNWSSEIYYMYDSRADSEIDSDGNLCFTYLDKTSWRYADVITFQKKSITGWSEEVIEHKFVSDYLNDISQTDSRLLFHPENGFYFVYRHPDQYLNNKLNVSYKIGALWHNDVIYESQSVLDYSCSAVFVEDDLHVVTYDAAKGALIHLFKRDDQWDQSIIDEEIVLNDFNTFRMGSDDSKHIVYFNSVDNTLVYLKNSSGTWSSTVVDTIDIPGRAPVSLELSPGNQPRICLFNPLRKTFSFYSLEDEIWNLESFDWIEEPVDSFDLAVSSCDQPHLVVQNSTSYYHVTKDRDDWVTSDVTVDSLFYAWGFIGPVEIAIDGNDHIYCCQPERTGSYRYGFDYAGNFVKVYPVFQGLYNQYNFYGALNGEVLKGFPMTSDRFGGVHCCSTAARQLGCHWENCFDYFHHNGYPSGTYHGTYNTVEGAHDIDCDSNGSLVDLTSSMIFSRINSQKFDTETYGTLFARDIEQLETDGNYFNVELQLDSRDFANICHLWHGDLAFTRQLETTVDLHLKMNHNYFAPGDSSNVELEIRNSGKPLTGIPFCCIAEIEGQFVFFPSWSRDPDYSVMYLPSGKTTLELLPEFKVPPDSDGAVTTITFYCGLLNKSMDNFLESSSGIETWTLNVGPEL